MAWDDVGSIKGPKGDTGATGTAGAKGDKGDTGSAGAKGDTGSTGAAGADGKTIRNGSGTPSSGLGVDGDFYVDTTAWAIYGPKTSGAWGSGQSLRPPVLTAPRTDSATSTYSADATVAGDIQLTCTGNTVITPSGTPNGRMLLVECLASGGARTVSVASGVALPASGGPTSRSLALTSGQVGVFGLRYSTLDSTWWLMSAEVF